MNWFDYLSIQFVLYVCFSADKSHVKKFNVSTMSVRPHGATRSSQTNPSIQFCYIGVMSIRNREFHHIINFKILYGWTYCQSFWWCKRGENQKIVIPIHSLLHLLHWYSQRMILAHTHLWRFPHSHHKYWLLVVWHLKATAFSHTNSFFTIVICDAAAAPTTDCGVDFGEKRSSSWRSRARLKSIFYRP